jgi:transcriptional antiterminator NusG
VFSPGKRKKIVVTEHTNETAQTGSSTAPEAENRETTSTPAQTGSESGQGTDQGQRAWYAIHTYSGYENKVKSHLEARINSMDMRNKIFRVIVPMEEEVEIKQGQRRTVQRKVFPGYVLVE